MRKLFIECLLAFVLGAAALALGLYVSHLFVTDDFFKPIVIGLCQGAAYVVFFKLRRRLFDSPRQNT